jgi:DNA-binding CsgD family transcriptional regulator
VEGKVIAERVLTIHSAPSAPASAFSGSMRTLRPLETERAALTAALEAALDAVGEGMLISEIGTVRELYRNRALREMLSQDPERESLAAGVRRFSSALHAYFGRRIVDASVAPPDLVQEIRTASARYTMRGSYVPLGALGRDGAVLVAVRQLGQALPSAEELRTAYGLTRREAEVARLLAAGASNAGIADALGVSPHTARHHTEKVLGKLGVTSRKALGLHLLHRSQPVACPDPIPAPYAGRTDSLHRALASSRLSAVGDEE